MIQVTDQLNLNLPLPIDTRHSNKVLLGSVLKIETINEYLDRVDFNNRELNSIVNIYSPPGNYDINLFQSQLNLGAITCLTYTFAGGTHNSNFIKYNKDDGIVVVDNLNSTNPSYALSANQGKVLNDNITQVKTDLNTLSDYVNNVKDKAKEVVTFEKGLISDEIISTFFTSGRLGSGFKIWVDESGKTHAEFDKVLVRDEFVANKLTIADVTSVGGQILLTVANMNCVKVEDMTDVYRCYFNTDNNTIPNRFTVGDQAICQTFNSSGSKYYWRLVTAIGADYIDLSKNDCDGTSIPASGDEIIQCGNRTNTSRQNAILISAYGDGPAIKQYAGIKSYSFVDCEKTVISDKYNKFTGDFYLETGESIATLLKIQEGLIKSQIQSIEHWINDKDNYLKNASFSLNKESWESGPSTALFDENGLLIVNGDFYADIEPVAEVCSHDNRYMLRLNNSFIKQLNENLNHPDKAGKFYLSFRYLCEDAGTLTCGFEGQTLYSSSSILVNNQMKIFSISGDWDGLGDFIMQFTGDIYISLVTLTNKPLDDYKVEVSTRFEQTDSSISAIVSAVNSINSTIANAGWLTESDKVKIWAALTFGETNTTLESLFEVTSSGIFLKSDHIDINGKVSFSSLTTDFQNTYANDLSNAQLAAKNGIAQQLGFTNYAQLVENALVGKTLISEGYINSQLIDAAKIITDSLLADKIKTVDIETNKLTAKEGSKLGNLKVIQKGALLGANHIFEEIKRYAIYGDGSVFDPTAFSNYIINNIGKYSTFFLSINASNGTYDIYLPNFEELQAAIGTSIQDGYGFTLKLIVPGKWAAAGGSTMSNDALFNITSKTNAQIYDNGFNALSSITLGKGDILELYGITTIESITGTSEEGNYTVTYGVDYYIKSRIQ